MIAAHLPEWMISGGFTGAVMSLAALFWRYRRCLYIRWVFDGHSRLLVHFDSARKRPQAGRDPDRGRVVHPPMPSAEPRHDAKAILHPPQAAAIT